MNSECFSKEKKKLKSNSSFFIIIFFLIGIFFITNCSAYQTRYNYYKGEHHAIYYPRNLDGKYIQDLSFFITRETSLFYGYFLPGFNVSDVNTVILIDTSPQRINVKLLKSINQKTPIMNFNQLLLGRFNHTVYINEDAAGLNLMGTNFIFLKKSKYDSLESLTNTYIAELSHILQYKNTAKSQIMVDNKYDYISEFFTDIISRIYMTGMTTYSFDEVRTKLDNELIKVFQYGYPDKLRAPDNFRLENLDDYLDDFLCLFHIMIEDELSYEKFKKTMVELYTKQYYTVDDNTIDRPFIDNYGMTIDNLVMAWSSVRM